MAKIKKDLLASTTNAITRPNNIQDEEQKKEQTLAQEQEEKEQIAPGSVGVNDTEKSLSALDFAANLAKTNLSAK